MITRRPVVLSSVAAVVLATSGCAFPTDLADPDPPPAHVAPSPVPAPRSAPEPVEVAVAALADRDGALSFAGSVRVARHPVDGLPPLGGSFAEDCALRDDGSVRTTAVDVTFTNATSMAYAGLAATVTLTAVDGGAPAAGSAVFVESSAPDTRWCQGDTTTPTVDGFGIGASSGDGRTVTAYVVAPAGVPAGGLVLRLSGLRNEAGSNASGPWDRVTASVGGCADDPTALCLPLG